MPTPKPPHAAAFCQLMVELVRAGRGTADLAREFGCNASRIHAWVKAAGGLECSIATGADAPLSMIERQELIELRRRFKQVQLECDVLSKATAWLKQIRQAHVASGTPEHVSLSPTSRTAAYLRRAKQTVSPS